MKPISWLLALTCVLSSISVHATPWYRIELMLVAYNDESLISHEQWPEYLAQPPVNVSSALRPLTSIIGFNHIPGAQWQLNLPPLDDLLLTSTVKRMEKRSDVKVLWHQAWVEPIQTQANAIVHPINVHLEGDVDMHLTGTVNFHLSRYLHISTDLIMQHSKKIPLQEDSQAVTETGVNGLEPVRAAHIQLSRRMRSGELHYLDHPMLGVVVKIVPVTGVPN